MLSRARQRNADEESHTDDRYDPPTSQNGAVEPPAPALLRGAARSQSNIAAAVPYSSNTGTILAPVKPKQCIILCFQRAELYWAVEVPVRRSASENYGIQDSEPDSEIWARLQRYWTASRYWWSRYLPCYGLIAAYEVHVEYLYKRRGRYVVRQTTEAGFKTRENALKDLAMNPYDELERLKLPYDEKSHESCAACAAKKPCRYLIAKNAEELLARLKYGSRFMQYLLKPQQAVDPSKFRNPLNGFANESCVLNANNIKRPEDCEDSRTNQYLPAIYVAEGFQWEILRARMPLVLVFIIAWTALWRLITGDWNITMSSFTILTFVATIPSVQDHLRRSIDSS